MFPSLVFRQAYDAIQTPHHGTKADLDYLRILHLAASTLQGDVESALVLLLAEKRTISSDAVKALVSTDPRPALPEMPAPEVDLSAYDALLPEVAA